jgi:hypothetical protein
VASAINSNGGSMSRPQPFLRALFGIGLALLTAIATPTFAATVIGRVDSLVSPAFLDRNGLTVPVAAGIELFAGDRLRTGSGARLLMVLGEGSAVRIGENATFEVTQAERKGGVFNAALAVVEGAFRFTTSALAKRQPRDVRISVARNATIGIRGTDLWGRGRGDKDIVCLIEGKIDVTGNDNKTQRLDQPLQFFQSTRTAPPEPISFIDPKQLAEWAKETDIPEGTGSNAKGVWRLEMSGFASRDAVQTSRRALRNAGYAAELAQNNTLTISGQASQAEAEKLAAQLKAAFGISSIRVSR